MRNMNSRLLLTYLENFLPCVLSRMAKVCMRGRKSISFPQVWLATPAQEQEALPPCVTSTVWTQHPDITVVAVVTRHLLKFSRANTQGEPANTIGVSA